MTLGAKRSKDPRDKDTRKTNDSKISRVTGVIKNIPRFGNEGR